MIKIKQKAILWASSVNQTQYMQQVEIFSSLEGKWTDPLNRKLSWKSFHQRFCRTILTLSKCICLFLCEVEYYPFSYDCKYFKESMWMTHVWAGFFFFFLVVSKVISWHFILWIIWWWMCSAENLSSYNI